MKEIQEKKTFVLFHVKYLMGLPTDFVQEVLSYPIDLMPAPQLSSFVVGMLNLRGTLIPVVDLRNMFGCTDTQMTPKNVIIAQYNTTFLGLVIDRLEEIVALKSSDTHSLPELLRKEMVNTFKEICGEGHFATLGEKSHAFCTIELPALIKRLS